MHRKTGLWVEEYCKALQEGVEQERPLVDILQAVSCYEVLHMNSLAHALGD